MAEVTPSKILPVVANYLHDDSGMQELVQALGTDPETYAVFDGPAPESVDRGLTPYIAIMHDAFETDDTFEQDAITLAFDVFSVTSPASSPTAYTNAVSAADKVVELLHRHQLTPPSGYSVTRVMRTGGRNESDLERIVHVVSFVLTLSEA